MSRCTGRAPGVYEYVMIMKAHVAEGDEVGRVVARAAGDGAQVPRGARALLPAREQRALQAVLAEVRRRRCTAAQRAHLRHLFSFIFSCLADEKNAFDRLNDDELVQYLQNAARSCEIEEPRRQLRSSRRRRPHRGGPRERVPLGAEAPAVRVAAIVSASSERGARCRCRSRCRTQPLFVSSSSG